MTADPPPESDAQPDLAAAIEPARMCERAASALSELIEVMNEETMLLRAGRLSDAAQLTVRKARLAQDYVQAARQIQDQAAAIRAAAPEAAERLRQSHAALATQLAENLRVLASAKSLTENLIGDVARRGGAAAVPSTYSGRGATVSGAGAGARGIAVNRAL
jgi:flagellar biosynthesis/type III secretory pathway chaperone